MVARHQDDQRLVVHDLVGEVEARLSAQEGHVETGADERLGKVRRIVARDRYLNVLQLVAGLEADGERLSFRLCSPARRVHRCINLRQGEPDMVKKGPARSGELDAMNAAREQLGSDLVLEVTNLPAQRWLRSVQP